MAVMDVQNIFADNQAVTATAFGSNFYDTSALTPSRNQGLSGARVRFTVGTAATAAGAATVAFELVEADNSDGSGNTTILASSAAIGKAALTAGAVPFDIVIPDTNRRFIGVRFTVATGPLTAGNFTAGVVLQALRNRNYPSSYTNAA